MKKFFCAIFSFVLVSLLCFTGCSDSWTEVQSITYHTDSRSNTFTSIICRKIGIQKIEKTEYDQASKEEKEFPSLGLEPKREIGIDRKSFLAAVKNESNKTYFVEEPELGGLQYTYYKYTISSYEIRYVKIRFSDNDCIEINYYDDDENKTEKVKATSYEITYFED